MITLVVATLLTLAAGTLVADRAAARRTELRDDALWEREERSFWQRVRDG